MIHYITGGERSGKSSLAQRLAEELSDSPYYLATARVFDDDFANRVQRHIDDRNSSTVRWTTIEAERYLAKAIEQHCQTSSHCNENSDDAANSAKPTIVIDCVTLWLTNYVMDYDYDIDHCVSLAKQEIDKLVSYSNQHNAIIFIVSNELGMSLHASTSEGRKFVSLQGWVNQYLAQVADKATLVVSGLPVTLK